MTGAHAALTVWKNNPELRLSDLSMSAFEKRRNGVQNILEEVANLERQLAAKMAELKGVSIG